MKKNILTFMFILISISVFILYKKIDVSGENENNTSQKIVNKKNIIDIKNKQKDELYEVQKEIIALKQKENGPDKLQEIVLLNSGDKQLVKLYSKLENNLFNNIQNNLPIKNIEKLNGKLRKFKIYIKDENNNPLSGANIYLWGYLLGKTNGKGELIKKIKLPRLYDYIYIQVFKTGYSWGFKKINNLNNEGSLVIAYIRLKKSLIKKIKNPNKFSIDTNNIQILSNTDCLLFNKNGKCYNKPASVEISYIKPEERDNLSIPTQAIYNGKLVNLQSNGMAFLVFRDDNNNLLKMNENYNGNVKICYKVEKKTIEERKKQRWTLENKKTDGYWWFDKSKGIWKFDNNAKVTIKDEKFCFETKHIY